MTFYETFTYTPQKGSLEGRVFKVELAEAILTPSILTGTSPYMGYEKYKKALSDVMPQYYSLVHKFHGIKIIETTPDQRRRILVPDGYNPNNAFRKVAKQFLVRMIQYDPLNPSIHPRAKVRKKPPQLRLLK